MDWRRGWLYGGVSDSRSALASDRAAEASGTLSCGQALRILLLGKHAVITVSLDI